MPPRTPGAAPVTSQDLSLREAVLGVLGGEQGRDGAWPALPKVSRHGGIGNRLGEVAERQACTPSPDFLMIQRKLGGNWAQEAEVWSEDEQVNPRRF